jgi:hypothetical protein
MYTDPGWQNLANGNQRRPGVSCIFPAMEKREKEAKLEIIAA